MEETDEAKKALLQQEKRLKQLSKMTTFEGLSTQHPFFSIYVLYKESFSRPMRYNFFYMRIIVYMTSTAVFAGQYNIIQVVFLSVLTGALFAVCSFLLQFMLARPMLKCCGVLLMMFITIFCWYSVLIVAALMGEDKANRWALDYAIAFGNDVFINQTLSGYVKFKLLQEATSKEVFMRGFLDNLIIKIVMNSELKEFIDNTFDM